MKRLLGGLLLSLTFASSGCLLFPPKRPDYQDKEPATTSEPKLIPAKTRLNHEEVGEDNYHEQSKLLENEMKKERQLLTEGR